MKSRIAASSCSTEVNLPRRIRFVVSSRMKRSTMAGSGSRPRSSGVESARTRAASGSSLQAQQRSSLRGKARRRGWALPRSAGTRSGAVRRREIRDSSTGPHPTWPPNQEKTMRNDGIRVLRRSGTGGSIECFTAGRDINSDHCVAEFLPQDRCGGRTPPIAGGVARPRSCDRMPASAVASILAPEPMLSGAVRFSFLPGQGS
jgi:hypothetical protein